MKHIMSINEFETMTARPSVDHKTQVLTMAWLAFLLGANHDDGLKMKDWKNDKRMDNMVCSDAMKSLVQMGFVRVVNGNTWKITKEGEKAAYDYWLEPTMEDAIAAGEKLKKFDTKDYLYHNKISAIPVDVWRDHDKANRKYAPSGKLTYQDYDYIRDFMSKYERTQVHSLAKMKKYAGYVNELCDDKEYVLYRGVNLSTDKHAGNYHQDIKVGMKIKSGTQDVQSWTTSHGVAVQFALGNPTPMEVSIDNNRFDDGFGVVMKHTFSPKQVVLDFAYVDESNPELEGSQDFNEGEVLVLVGKDAEFEVTEVHKEHGDTNPHW